MTSKWHAMKSQAMGAQRSLFVTFAVMLPATALVWLFAAAPWAAPTAGAPVSPSAAVSLDLSGLADGSAGAAQSPTVIARDADGNVASGYRGQVRFSSTDGRAVLPENYTFTAGDAGVHTFTDAVTLKTAGSQQVTATDTAAGSLSDTASVTISPGPAVSFSLTRLANGFAGVPQSPRVTARDLYGNIASGYRGTVSFRASGGPFCIASISPEIPTNYTFTAADAGTHLFTGGVVIKVALGWTVSAIDTADSTVTGSRSFTIRPAGAKTLRLTGLADAVAGTEQSATATLRDAYGNVASGYRGQVRF